VAADAVCFPLDHPYVERCWTSVVGPTGVALLRRAAVLFSASSHPTIDLLEVARDLGITGSDASRRMHRTLLRLERLGFIERSTCDEVHVYVDVPPLPTRELRRSTPALRAVHMSLLRERRIEVGRSVVVDGSMR
jgi:DNA-binding MarR family transcriptional regulator